MSKNDHTLLVLFTRIAGGDQTSFNALHSLMFRSLYQYAMMYLKSKENAEEATADIFVKLWTSRAQLVKIDRPQLYMFKSLKNICFNIERRDRLKKTALVELDDQDVQSEAADPVQLLHNKELKELLTAIVAALPEQRRIAFTMIKEHGMTSKEVAELLGISQRTVENHLYKAVKQLAASIEIYLEKDPLVRRKGRNLFTLFF